MRTPVKTHTVSSLKQVFLQPLQLLLLPFHCSVKILILTSEELHSELQVLRY